MVFETWLQSDLKEMIQVQRLTGNLFTDDNACNVIGVVVTDDGAPATLTGSCVGYFIRDDGQTVVVQGETHQNTASVTLNNGCYDVVGQFSLVIKVGNVTVGACTGYVYRSKSDIVIDPGGVVPSIQDLLDRLTVVEGLTDQAEAWATGQINGVDIPPTNPAHENNAKYYSDQMDQTLQDMIDESFCIETGPITSFPKVITDERIFEDCFCEDYVVHENIDIGWVTLEGKVILYGTLPTGTTLPSQKLKIRRYHGLTSDTRTVTLREVETTGEDGNYLVAETRNLIPGTQYSWRLYSVSGNTETYVYGIGATASYPTYNMWFAQVARGLTDGTVYKVKVSPTLDSSDTTASNTVTFVAATLPEGE